MKTSFIFSVVMLAPISKSFEIGYDHTNYYTNVGYGGGK